jgi:hypothetical protein
MFQGALGSFLRVGAMSEWYFELEYYTLFLIYSKEPSSGNLCFRKASVPLLSSSIPIDDELMSVSYPKNLFLHAYARK